MTFLKWLKTALGFSQTDTAKSSSVKDAVEITQAVENGILESVESVSEKQHSLAAHSMEKSGEMMTVDQAKKKWVDWNKSQVGYHEALDGSNKYADGVWDVKLYGFSAKNVPWCDVYSDYSYIACFGYDAATKMTFQQPKGYAACALSADVYKSHGRFYPTPEVGDQIFFDYGGINHVGNVIAVEGDTVYCVEGNFSDSVSFTQYNIRNQWLIAGYGRPDWSVVADDGTSTANNAVEYEEPVDEFDNVHPEHPRSYIHLEYGDGISSNGQTPKPQVKAWQNLLLCWGFDVGKSGADGEFGFDTENATIQWQEYVNEIGGGVEVNGCVDEDDWVEILNVPG